MGATPGVTPVTVLTGFLGSGKSTLLNRLLADPAIEPCAVVVNEWGEIPIDHALLRSARGEVAVLPGGCLCCQVAGDLVRTLRDLHARRASGEVPAFSRVVIETTGLADPAPLLRTLVELPLVAARYGLAGVVTTVDAEHGLSQLDAHPEAVKQAAMADALVLTKSDRADPGTAARLEARLAAMNPGALRHRTSLTGGIGPTSFFATGLGARAPSAATGWLNAGAYSHAGGHTVSVHDPRIHAFSWSMEGDCEATLLEDALDTLLDVIGDRLLRLKGLANVRGLPGPLAVHAVQHTLYPLARLPAWPDADRRTRLVFITRDIGGEAVTGILKPLLRPAAQVGAARADTPQPTFPATEA
jgi:G3E family GTPase